MDFLGKEAVGRINMELEGSKNLMHQWAINVWIACQNTKYLAETIKVPGINAHTVTTTVSCIEIGQAKKTRKIASLETYCDRPWNVIDSRFHPKIQNEIIEKRETYERRM